MRKQTLWFPNRSNTNQVVQSQKQAICLKTNIQEEVEVFYPCSENKGADLCLCFRVCRLLVSSWGGSFDIYRCKIYSDIQRSVYFDKKVWDD